MLVKITVRLDNKAQKSPDSCEDFGEFSIRLQLGPQLREKSLVTLRLGKEIIHKPV